MSSKDSYKLLTCSKSLYSHFEYYFKNTEINHDDIDRVPKKYYPYIRNIRTFL